MNRKNTRNECYNIIVKTNHKQLQKEIVYGPEELIDKLIDWCGDFQVVEEVLNIELADRDNPTSEGWKQCEGNNKLPKNYPCMIVFYHGAFQYLTEDIEEEIAEYDAERRPDIEYVYPSDFAHNI
jgi:hypothetical protein